jgi:O-antigen ligase
MTRLNHNVPRTNTISVWFVRLGLGLCVVAALLWLSGQYATLSTLNPYYRINTSALCLLLGFALACFSMRCAIMGCVFALPLLPTFAWQFQVYTGYGRIQDTSSPGLDLVVGIMLGLIAQALASKTRLRDRFALPWPAALVMLVLTASVAMAIARNLNQTTSPFALQGLLYNIVNMRSLGWHDDYRPLVDWAAYGVSFLLLAMFVPALKNMPDRNEVIFKPLIAGLVIAALVGWRQSTTGAGLSQSQLYFRPNEFGYMALGFQSDLHAFAGHMLLGALGLWGYLYYKKNTWLRLFLLGTVIPFCWLMLFLSKSKATFAAGILGLIAISAIWLCRHTKYIKHVVLGAFVCALLLPLSVLLFTETWTALLTFTLNKFNLPDLNALNLKLSYRPEVYLAALRMFALFPFAGLGQSEFYRQSANYDLTHSFFLSVDQSGENAHNYFLQTLAETGLLGIGAFILLLTYPLFRGSNKRALIPAAVALCAIFSGNLFAHSMLIRENLLLAACFVALIYATMKAEHVSLKVESMPYAPSSHRRLSSMPRLLYGWVKQPKAIMFSVMIVSVLMAKELYQSFKSRPFNSDLQCHEPRRVNYDGWTSGRHVFEVPVGARGMILDIVNAHPDSAKRPLEGSLTLWYNRAVLLKQSFSFATTGPQHLEIYLPNETIATPDDYQIELRLQRCFVPRDFGMNSDGRRLGVNVKSIDWP